MELVQKCRVQFQSYNRDWVGGKSSEKHTKYTRMKMEHLFNFFCEDLTHCFKRYLEASETSVSSSVAPVALLLTCPTAAGKVGLPVLVLAPVTFSHTMTRCNFYYSTMIISCARYSTNSFPRSSLNQLSEKDYSSWIREKLRCGWKVPDMTLLQTTLSKNVPLETIMMFIGKRKLIV